MERAEHGIIFDGNEKADEDIVWLMRMFLSHADESFANQVASARLKLSRQSPRLQISFEEARAVISGLTNFNDKLPPGHGGFKKDLTNATQAIEAYL